MSLILNNIEFGKILYELGYFYKWTDVDDHVYRKNNKHVFLSIYYDKVEIFINGIKTYTYTRDVYMDKLKRELRKTKIKEIIKNGHKG